MKDNFDSDTYGESSKVPRQAPAWVKVTTIAAVSALAGGIAAAWFYRKTLKKLQHAGAGAENSNFGISEPKPGDED